MGEPAPIAVDSKGAADLLGISERMVRMLTVEGRLPVIDVGEHRNRIYSVDALRRWALESSRVEEVADATPVPKEGRPVGRRGPGRPRKSRASGETLPLRVVGE